MQFVVPVPEKISLNKIYAGVHFRERSEHKESYRLAVACAKGAKRYKGDFPVALHFHFRLHGTPLDISNHGYMLKMVEDGMVASGVLPGDEPKYVQEIRVTAEKIAKANEDEVVVTISPACDSTLSEAVRE